MDNQLKNRVEILIVSRPSTQEAIMWWGACKDIRNNRVTHTKMKTILERWRITFDNTTWMFYKLDEIEKLLEEKQPDGTGLGEC